MRKRQKRMASPLHSLIKSFHWFTREITHAGCWEKLSLDAVFYEFTGIIYEPWFFYCTYFIMLSKLEFTQNDEAKRIDCLKPHRNKENDKPDLKPNSCNP